MNLRLRRSRRQPSPSERVILATIKRQGPDQSERWTPRRVGFVAFWLFVGFSTGYVAAQTLLAFGLDRQLAGFVGVLVGTAVLLFAGRREPR